MKREKQTSYNRPAPVEGLPESPELERAVLGALILEPGQLPDLMEIIGISAFSDPNNGKIYGEMLSMLERNEKIDLYTLSQRPELKGREMLRYLSELTNAVGSGVNVLEHARQLANTEIRRRLYIFGYELAARAVSDPDGVVDWATTEITCDSMTGPCVRMTSRLCRMSCGQPSTIWNDDSQARQAGECIGIPTGLRRLDALTGGWRGGQLVVLAGRPGMGKKRYDATFCPCCGRVGRSRCMSIRWKCSPGSWPGVCWSAARV